MELKVYKQDALDQSIFDQVQLVGNSLFSFCNSPESEKKFKEANQPGNSSAKIQNVFLPKAQELNFESEKKNLFKDIPTQNLRPDYYKKIQSSGIIIEVERGKTVMNNMDLLDLWKCHLCNSANHLFLFVPTSLRQNNKSNSTNCFRIVSNRMEPFFEKQNYTNVHSLWIFGY